MNICKPINNFLRVLFAVGLLYTHASCLNMGSTDQHGIRGVNPVFNIQSLDDLYDLFTHSQNSYPLVSAHRGGPSKGFPENAIETFANIASHMPAIIECDIRITKDSVLVLMHDETIDRTTNGHGNIHEMSYEELRQFNLVDTEGNPTPYKVPTLESALLWGKNRVIFTLDVKKNVPYKAVVDMIRKTKSEPYVILITYNANQAELVNLLAPDLLISASIRQLEDLARLDRHNVPDNRIVAFVGVSEPDSALYERLHNHGIRAILGTMGNLDRRAEQQGYQFYAELVERGAGILSTDRPFDAHKALSYYIGKRKLSSPYVR